MGGAEVVGRVESFDTPNDGEDVDGRSRGFDDGGDVQTSWRDTSLTLSLIHI